MSSTIESTPSSTSSDVENLSQPLNHINNNHTESSTTIKSLKRTRSPSLTRDSNEQTNDSSDIPAKKLRKKRNTTDIDQSLGRHLSADKLHVYPWPTDEPHADLHVLQEQICDYLSLKSFKRKYPDIYRRIVDLHEREYLKSQNVVTEAQCDLGLTALKLDEVLHLMSIDYPEKYQQFNHVWQQKRRALTQNHSKPPSTLLSASIVNHSANLIDNGDKPRNTKLSNNIVRNELIRSTVDYNSQLQKERRHDRKACFDLQTMQIHFPLNRQFRLPSHLTKIGSYPLALLPGQYQDSYIKYAADELKYMPINTALYYYPKSTSLIHSDRLSQQGTSSDEEDEGIRTMISNPSTPQSPLIVNGNGPISNRQSIKSSKSISMNSQTNLCHMCKTIDEENDDELVKCNSCNHQYHPLCLEVNNDMLNTMKTYAWQCMDCKSCVKCTKTHDEANMMFCDRCDRGYHSYCVGLEAIPDGSWQCSLCDPPPPPPQSKSPSPVIKGKRGRPSTSSSSRLSPKSEVVPARVSSRRKLVSTPLSPSNNSNSSSIDLQSNTNSSSMNLILTRNQQQWTSISNNNNNSMNQT